MPIQIASRIKQSHIAVLISLSILTLLGAPVVRAHSLVDPAQRSSWKPDGWIPDAVVISHGTNDFNLQVKDPISQQDWMQAVHYPGDDCSSHPTRAQHRRIAEDMEPVLREALGW